MPGSIGGGGGNSGAGGLPGGSEGGGVPNGGRGIGGGGGSGPTSSSSRKRGTGGSLEPSRTAGPRPCGKTSLLHGVCYHRASGRWLAHYRSRDGVREFLGSYHAEHDAALAYDTRARSEKKPVNFPKNLSEVQAGCGLHRETKYTGIKWSRRKLMWVASITIYKEGTRAKEYRVVGESESEETAARLRDDAAKLLTKNPRLNFPSPRRTSPLAGVEWSGSQKKWHAFGPRPPRGQARLSLGYLKTEEDAGLLRDRAVLALSNGPTRSKLNFPALARAQHAAGPLDLTKWRQAGICALPADLGSLSIKWVAQFGGAHLGLHGSEEAAARRVDVRLRQLGRSDVNFPEENETRAVSGRANPLSRFGKTSLFLGVSLHCDSLDRMELCTEAHAVATSHPPEAMALTYPPFYHATTRECAASIIASGAVKRFSKGNTVWFAKDYATMTRHISSHFTAAERREGFTVFRLGAQHPAYHSFSEQSWGAALKGYMMSSTMDVHLNIGGISWSNLDWDEATAGA